MSANPNILAARARAPSAASFVLPHMSSTLDELSLRFAIWTRTADGLAMDVGCGDGVATVAALARGGRVVAVDPDCSALERLRGRVPADQRARLRLHAGRVPEFEFKPGGLCALHAGYVLHLLAGDEIEASFTKFFSWLYPEGRLFISVLTPMGDHWQPFRAEFARRLAASAKWPGYIKFASSLNSTPHDGVTMVNLLDDRILRPVLKVAGFSIEEVSWYSVPWDSAQKCCGITARCDR
jgi:SAM-dependent methyltransferase